MTSTLIAVMLVGAALAVGGAAAGLLAGYWRGRKRGYALAQANIRRAELDVLAGVGKAILSVQLKVDALCEVIYQQATRIVDTRNFQLGLFDHNDYVIQVWLRNAERLPPQRFSGQANEGIVGWVRRSGKGLLVRDFRREWDELPARPSATSNAHPARSAIFAPLLSGGATLGVIAVQSDEPNAFNERDLRLLTLLANQASPAIRNAQMLEAAQERARQLRLINDVTRQVTAIQPLPALFHQIVTLIHNAFGYYAVNIFILDEKTQTIQLKASSHEAFQSDSLSLTPQQGLVGWAIRERETVIVTDVAADERYLPLTTLDATRSEIVVPLLVQERVLGVLDVQSNRADAFGGDDAFLLETLAGQVALAIQEAQTYHAERRQRERVNALVEVARAVVSILDIDALLEEVADLVADTLGYDRVHLFLRLGEHVVFRSGSGVHSGRWALEELSFPLESDNIIARVARSGQPEVLPHVSADEWGAVGGVDDTRSEMAVPIRIGAHILGVFDIHSTTPQAFSADDVALIQALADTVAVALRNATLFANEARRRELAETLRALSTALAASLDLGSTLGGIMTGLERVVPYDCGAILLRDEEANVFRVATVHGAAVSGAPEVWQQTLPADQADEAQLFAMLHALIAHPHPDDAVKDQLAVALEVAGRVTGYLLLARLGAEHFTTEERAIISTFANQAAVAITNAQLVTAQQEEAWITTALLQVAEAVNTQLDTEASLETIVRLTPLLVGVERCGILKWQPEQAHFVGGPCWGLATEEAQRFGAITLPVDKGLFLQRLAQGGDAVICGEAADCPLPPALYELFASPALLGLPLVARGQLVGAMLVDHPTPNRPLDQRRARILSGIAHQTALALENARLQKEAAAAERLERELEVARDIQTSFLPDHTPQIAGWEVGAFYRAARQVGGDFYDFFPIDAEHWAIVIADVADKGVPAALYMALSRTLLRAVGSNHHSPAETLQRVNQLLLRDTHSDLFVTVWYGIWHPASGTVRYSSAGHNPPLVVRADGRVERLQARGIALGVIPEIALVEREVTLQAHDLLAAYTDGVTEAQRENAEQFGMAGLEGALLTARERSASAVVSAVVDALDTFVGGAPQFDDITLVVVKRVEQ